MVDLSKFTSNEVCSQTVFLHLRIKLYNCMGSFFFFFFIGGGVVGGEPKTTLSHRLIMQGGLLVWQIQSNLWG